MKEFRKSVYRIYNDISNFDIIAISTGAGTGTLNVSGGQPLEVISLFFEVTPDPGNFNNFNFSAPVSVGSLDPVHLTRNGSITLDSLGNATSIYTVDPTTGTSTCMITVTARSSGLTDGVGDSTDAT